MFSILLRSSRSEILAGIGDQAIGGSVNCNVRCRAGNLYREIHGGGDARAQLDIGFDGGTEIRGIHSDRVFAGERKAIESVVTIRASLS